jgi:two-component system, response regulator
MAALFGFILNMGKDMPFVFTWQSWSRSMNEKYIFLAENNSNDVALTIKALEKCQIQNKLVVVSDGAEALSCLLPPDLLKKPAVVILDLKLPFMDGFEVLRQIRADKNTRHLPVYILSSSINRSFDRNQ